MARRVWVTAYDPAWEAQAAQEAAAEEKAKKLSLVMARLAEMISGVDIEDPAAFVSLVAEMF